MSAKDRDSRILETWDAYKAAPENKYLRPSPMVIKVAAKLDLSYQTVVKVLAANGRYTVNHRK